MTLPGGLAFLYRPPHSMWWLPAFAAAAMLDPVAGEFLGQFIGPETETVMVHGKPRAKVPGEVHFAATYAVIKPGFLGEGSAAYTQHTIDDHVRTGIPAALLAEPVSWIIVMQSNVADFIDRPGLHTPIREAGLRFAADIHADMDVVGVDLATARARLAAHFAGVQVAEEPGRAFWRTMDHGPIRADLGGRPGQVNTAAIMDTLNRHLPEPFVRQLELLKP